MFVCICNGVTDSQIRQAAQAGCRTMSELTMRTGAGANCGSCVEAATSLLEEASGTRGIELPVLSQAA